MDKIETILNDARLMTMETNRVLNNTVIRHSDDTVVFNDIHLKNIFSNDNLQVFHITYPPLTKVEEHIHDNSIEVFYVIKGSLIMGPEIVYAGDSIVIEAGEEHNGKSGPTTTEAIAIVAPPEKEYTDLFERNAAINAA